MPQDTMPAETGKHPIETIAIIAAAVITAAVTVLSMTVFKDPGFHLDLDYLMALQNFREYSNDIFTGFFQYVTYLGTGHVIIFLLILVYFCFSTRTGLFLVQVLGYSSMLNGLLKPAVSALRPWMRDELIVPAGDAKVAATGFSFPSGHSTTATGFFGGLVSRLGSVKPYLWVVCPVIILLVMFSRNYLGVHTPQDVLIGLISTIFIVLLMHKIFRWISRGNEQSQGRKKGMLFLISVILSLLAVVFIECRSYPETVDAAKLVQDSYKNSGFFLGASFTLFFLHYFRGYEAENATLRQKVIMTALAVILALLSYYCLNGALKELMPVRLAKVTGSFFTVFGVFGLLPALAARLGYGVSGDAKSREN